MASKARSVWAIDIGNCSLKALNLGLNDDGIEVLDFEVIEHSQILSAPGIDQDQLLEQISLSIAKLTEKHDLRGEYVVISVAGQTSFARFIKLPPVEPKKVPQIIQFEAVQQIPFDINEVEWDYQIMDDPDSPEVSVGIFAIKNEIVSDILDSYSSENVRVSSVQMAPVAIYNYAHYDSNEFGNQSKKATVVIDMGTDSTNIVICSQNTVWQRTVPMGGNDFTEAIAEAFKLDFKKAEKLKKTAPVSKYSKQIFQAMKPVYTNFAEEVQRSIGYFSSTNSVTLTKVVALGGGMKLQGLSKYLQQSLGTPVVRPDSFERLSVGQTASSAKFHENIAEYGIAYGLGVQALGEAKIKSDLLPKRIARAMAWQQKSSILTIAAGILLVAGILCLMRAFIDKGAYASNKSVRSSVNSALSKARKATSALSKQKNKDNRLDRMIEEQFELFKYRNIIPNFMDGLISCLPNAENTPEQADLFQAFDDGDIEAIKAVPRGERKMLFVTSCTIDYADSVETAMFGETKSRSRKSGGSGGGGMMGFGMGMPGMGMPGMGMPGMGMPGMGGGFTPGGKSGGRASSDEESTQDDAPGFLIVIEGYSPYAEIGDLLDPADVGKDQAKWGFITRLMNFDKIYKNGKFELYQKDSVTHFIFEEGEVDPESTDMPAGIGKEVSVVRVEVEESASRGRSRKNDGDRITEEDVLLDPMTGEEISKIAVIDETGLKVLDKFGEEQFEVRDHWFRVKAKFVWKEAPEVDKDN